MLENKNSNIRKDAVTSARPELFKVITNNAKVFRQKPKVTTHQHNKGPHQLNTSQQLNKKGFIVRVEIS